MKAIKDNVEEGRTPGSRPLLASISSLPSLVAAASQAESREVAIPLVMLRPYGLRKSPDTRMCLVMLFD